MSKVNCLVCNSIIESKFRHDFQECGCENRTYVDGGNDYTRIGGLDFSKINLWTQQYGWRNMTYKAPINEDLAKVEKEVYNYLYKENLNKT